MRLQVFLSHSGACSRRKALELIKAGRVKVNNAIIVEPSHAIDASRDVVILEGERLSLKEEIYLILNKPKGVTTTKKDPFAEKTVMDLLPGEYSHLFPVGRLDRDTTGLLILTNDGDFSYRLMHPSFKIDKVYIATLDKPLVEDHKVKMQRGVVLEGEQTLSCRIENSGNKQIKITMREGRKRQIRRMLALFKYKVIELERVSFGGLNLGNLPLGHWRMLSHNEISNLKNKK
jgi:pseudouridine synthase